MRSWAGQQRSADIMGPSVTRTGSGKEQPTLKNGSDLRESGYLIAVGSRTARFRRKHKNKLLTFILAALLLILLILSIVMTVLYIKQKKHHPLLCESKECLRSAANLAMSMDMTADPCDDFYKYTCGNWASEHPRPDAYISYDWFRDKQTKVYSMVRDFLSKNITHDKVPVERAKVLFDACMDTETLDKRGLKPIQSILETIGLPPYPTFVNVTEDFDYSTYSFDWLEVVIKIKIQLGMDVLIGFDIFTDPKNSSVYRLVMGSPETTNPFPSMHIDRKRQTNKKNHNYYPKKRNIIKESFDRTDTRFEGKESKSDDEDKTTQLYKLFYAELIKLFVIEAGQVKDEINETELDKNIVLAANEYTSFNEDIYQFETINDTDTTTDDFLNIPDYTVDEIQAHTDYISESNNGTATPIWKKYLEGVFAISDVSLDFENDKILVSELDLKYMALMASYLSKSPPVVIELYIWIKVVEVMAAHTTSELRILFQRSYEESRRRESTPPRSLQCAGVVNDMMGMAVAYAIADPGFVNVTKPKWDSQIKTMIYEMKNVLARLIGRTKWMDDDTKLATYYKIIEMKALIGFPDWLYEDGSLERYYEGIEVNKDTHLENMINIIQVKIKKALNKFREGNNSTWATDPTEVNAYHTFQENTITIPLVMLQYPFYDLGLDSLNYGSIGTIVGHEITHGFDNFGRQFDRNGNLLPWWTNNTVASFVNMTQCFVDQYSKFYVPELDDHVDGKKTLGENIADNGGLREALSALRDHLRKYGPEKKLPGFEHMNSEQLFFLSFGNLWCGVSTKESLQGDLEDEHSPQQFRALGALQNSVEFARAFHCKHGTKMNPRSRCIMF